MSIFGIIRFVDRDIVMRFHGGGVGHTSTCMVSNLFMDDRNPLDLESRERRKETAHSSSVVEALGEGDFDEAREGSYLDSEPADSESDSIQDDSLMDENEDPDGELEDYGYCTVIDNNSENADDSAPEDLEAEDDDELGAEDGEAEDDEGLEGFAEL